MNFHRWTTPSNSTRSSMPNPTLAERAAHLPAKLEAEALPISLEDARQVADAVSRALRRAARTARAPASIISGGSGIRARRGDRAFRLGLIISFFVMFVGPLLVESVYWGLIASKQYSTELKFAIRTGQVRRWTRSAGCSDSAPRSRRKTRRSSPTTSRAALWWSRSTRNSICAESSPAPTRTIYRGSIRPRRSRTSKKYWRNRVDVKIESCLRNRRCRRGAFTPAESLAIGQQILVLSEALVNDLSSRSRRDASAESRAELDRAEERLQAATTAMRDARNAEGVLDAKAAAEALDKVVGVLRLEKAKLEQVLRHPVDASVRFALGPGSGSADRGRGQTDRRLQSPDRQRPVGRRRLDGRPARSIVAPAGRTRSGATAIRAGRCDLSERLRQSRNATGLSRHVAASDARTGSRPIRGAGGNGRSSCSLASFCGRSRRRSRF